MSNNIYKNTLIDTIKSYDPDADLKHLEFACEYSKEAHGTQKRASGAPYYHHPLEVAIILAEMHLDQASIVTALLHDTIEDTDITSEDIFKNFGQEITSLVDGVTKLAKIEYQTEHTRQAENFRKLLLAMSEDIRVLLVKLADRLHNMRTLHFVKSPEKRLRIAHETMDIYAPLAERIGMQQFKNELQDLAFSELHPEARESIMSRLDYLKENDQLYIDHIIESLTKTLHDAGLKNTEVFGREKTPCSIWRKMERNNVSFEQLSDIIAFRIMTDTVEECYHVLGIIHTHYQMVPETFKDFISTPKSNGYQSLHTIIMGPDQRFIETQIRTRQMHGIAELGVAAHWSYKQKREYSTDGKQYKWVRELLYILEHSHDPLEFLENTKLEINYEQVFCFTPKGGLVALPKGATAVDFAYDVHSDVGNRCTGTKINGRIMPLRTQLQNGDQVDIITSETQVPSPMWGNFVVTGKAKSEIKRFVRAQEKEEYIKLGRSLLNKRLKEESVKITSQKIKASLQILGKKHLNDIYIAIGEGNMSPNDVLKALFPNKKLKKTRKKSPFALLSFSRNRNKEHHKIPIKGLKPGVAVYFADCCHPIPGDIIIGVVTTGKGMTIHTSDCSMLTNFSSTPERLVDVSWGNKTGDQFISRLRIILSNTEGSLATLTNVVAKQKCNISNLKIKDRSSDFFEMELDLAVKGESHLSNIIKSLKTKRLIHSVERLKR